MQKRVKVYEVKDFCSRLENILNKEEGTNYYFSDVSVNGSENPFYLLRINLKLHFIRSYFYRRHHRHAFSTTHTHTERNGKMSISITEFILYIGYQILL